MARGEAQQPSTPSQAANPNPSSPSTPPSQDKPPSRFRTKIHKISSWLSTTEPSSQALKQHKKSAFQKAGISPSDTEAPSKLHAPIGEIPADAIKPTTGPSPEEVLLKKRKAEQKRKRQQQQQSASTSVSVSMSGASGSIQSPSWSGYSSASSPKGSVSGPADDDFGANGWGSR